MSVPLDVNLLLACCWQTHARHAEAVSWLEGLAEFHTCPLVELGFLRVSKVHPRAPLRMTLDFGVFLQTAGQAYENESQKHT